MDANADRFLNCVMGRSEHDTLFHIIAAILIMILIPALSTETIIEIVVDEDESLKDQALLDALMLTWTIVLFVQFLEVRGLSSHRIRDLEWTDSLIGYSRSRGHDVSRMEALMENSRIGSPKKVLIATKTTFAVLAVLNFAIIIMFSNEWMDGEYETQIGIGASMLILLEIALVSLYIDRITAAHDQMQHEFSSLLIESMGEDMAGASPMSSAITGKGLKIWFHLLAVAATLGAYSIVFNMLVIHRMNRHISSQWAYEQGLVTAIARLEGATKIVRAESEEKEGIVMRAMSIFR